MIVEDLLTYTEQDTGNNYTVTSSKVGVVGLPKNISSHLQDDKGVNHFAGDVSHDFELYFDSASTTPQAYIDLWMLANAVDDHYNLRTASEFYLSVALYSPAAGTYRVYIREGIGGSDVDDFGDISADTLYYATVDRDESIGTNGQFRLRLYSDALRTTIVLTLTLALTAKRDFRHFYAANSFNIGAADTFTGYGQNYDLQESLNLTVNNAESAAFAESVTLTQSHQFTVADAMAQAEAEAVTIAQQHGLSPLPAYSDAFAEDVGLTQEHQFNVSDVVAQAYAESVAMYKSSLGVIDDPQLNDLTPRYSFTDLTPERSLTDLTPRRSVQDI